MKTITTLSEIIRSELIRRGFSDFENKNKSRVIFYDDDAPFIKKCMNYDKDVDDIVTIKFFINNRLENLDYDKAFKKLWLNRFLSHEIGFQTMERFASQNTMCFLKLEKQIFNYYENFNKYLTGNTDSSNTGTDSKTSEMRNLESTLPQSEINLNISDDELAYGDNNTIQKNKDDGLTTNKSSSNNYSINNLDSAIRLDYMGKILNKFEKKCFLKIW